MRDFFNTQAPPARGLSHLEARPFRTALRVCSPEHMRRCAQKRGALRRPAGKGYQEVILFAQADNHFGNTVQITTPELVIKEYGFFIDFGQP